MSEQVLDYHTLLCLRGFFNACLILFLFYIPLPMKINFYAHTHTQAFFSSVLKKEEGELEKLGSFTVQKTVFHVASLTSIVKRGSVIAEGWGLSHQQRNTVAISKTEKTNRTTICPVDGKSRTTSEIPTMIILVYFPGGYPLLEIGLAEQENCID